jgi:hypothetical protein
VAEMSGLQYRNIPRTPEKLGPIKKKPLIRGITPDNYAPKISSYSNKKPKNPLNKKYIEQLLDR